ncbi:beta-ketoacyl-ACP synthase III [Gloeobacter morelensis]|uniref:Beta-ketoacyl-[acyl-carrier-protein] synthase III n=1 Tax=Gloeobacter morelensis MG652769 TaxID=2781736 RepID=A0ABY3PIK6_9CYAN|nr:beta-ketoacyl-ACP synthase III [Gloeobacter morelensis]UFP93506.1 ketoacyl-ACP synthase III [Gloeobacter morelensis MG652769]
MPAVQMTGVGGAVPAQVLTNHHLSALVTTSDEWIASRTGIRSRRILAPGQSLTQLAARAAAAALAQAGRSPLDVDLLILATSTPDDLFGGAAHLQHEIGAVRAVAFDLTAACSGFVFALATASQFVRTGTYRTVLVVGADALSRFTDWTDRATCVLFGDGAGAVLLEAGEAEGILGFELRTDGARAGHLNVYCTVEAVPLAAEMAATRARFASITMNGREVYRFAVEAVPDLIEKTLAACGVGPEQVKAYLLHQANQRILDSVAHRLRVAPERMASNLADYGNTSSASVPLILQEWVQDGRIEAGDRVVLAGFGAGLSWGVLLARWGRL